MRVEDWLGKNNTIGIDIWTNKYQFNDESFEEFLTRVSGGNKELRQLIQDKKFLFGGRTLSNRGTGRKGSYNNCYSRGYIEDNIEDIMKANQDLALTYKAQGGQGVSLSKIRPKGTPIGSDFVSDGIVPFMEIFNTTTASISQGGARKGALMISLDIRHKEAEEFITIKTNSDKITKANLSLEIDDDFMSAVQEYYVNGTEVTLHERREYEGHIVEYDIKPIQLYKLMMKTVYDWAEPGCLFTQKLRNYNLMEYDPKFEIDTTNPCGEQPLKKNMSCNLGSLNLAEFVTNAYTEKSAFDVVSFKEAVYIAVRALDDIVDENMNNHPLKAQKTNARDYRNIGLGVFNYGQMLFALGLTYGSEKAITFTENLFKLMLTTALEASNSLAKEKGMFPKCKPKDIVKATILQDILKSKPALQKDILKYGLRNCSLLSVAPTGSIGTMMNGSGGCEPEFALKYTRHTDNLGDSYDIYSKSIEEYWAINGECAYEDLPSYFVTALSIPWKNRIDTQAAIQKYVDTAISSTVNLPEDTTVEEIEQLYLYAWQKGLKGVTIYRSGCKRTGILVSNETTSDEVTEDKFVQNTQAKTTTIPRGFVIEAYDDAIGKKRKLITGCGSLHVSAFFNPVTGEIVETYLSKGSTGGCNNFMIGLSRMISLAARSGAPIEAIIDQLNSCGACPSYAVRSATKHDTSKGACCPMAIGNALKDMYDEMQRELTDNSSDEDEGEDDKNYQVEAVTKPSTTKTPVCPECGSPLIFEGGCNICKNCGWSKCD